MPQFGVAPVPDKDWNLFAGDKLKNVTEYTPITDLPDKQSDNRYQSCGNVGD